MHHLLKVIIPKVDADKVEETVAKVLEPFDENGEDRSCSFFDWFEIGGRWDDGEDNVRSVADITDTETAYRVVIAWNSPANGIYAHTMLVTEVFNGVCFQETKWDGRVKSAIEYHCERVSGYREEVRDELTVKDDWLVIIVDYHS